MGIPSNRNQRKAVSLRIDEKLYKTIEINYKDLGFNSINEFLNVAADEFLEKSLMRKTNGYILDTEKSENVVELLLQMKQLMSEYLVHSKDNNIDINNSLKIMKTLTVFASISNIAYLSGNNRAELISRIGTKTEDLKEFCETANEIELIEELLKYKP